MLFKIFDQNTQMTPNTAVLYASDWNDWFKYETRFSLVIYTSDGKTINAGNVKVAIRDQKDQKLYSPQNSSY